MKADLLIPDDNDSLLAELKTQVQQSRVRASLQVNSELINLYWLIGKRILERQEKAQWGDKLLERLANDSRQAFVDMKGSLKSTLNTYICLKKSILQLVNGSLTNYFEVKTLS